MKQKLFLLIASISFFSCSQERLTDVADDTLSVDGVSATTQSLLIDKDAVSLTSQDAKNVASLFRSKNGGASSRSASDLASESTSVETIIDSTTSEPLLYIVNWANDGGFVVVSATKKCFPVACYSETGNFSLDADPASKSYLEGYKSLIRDALNDTSDSLRARYALEWSVFEQSGSASAGVSSRATSSDIQDMIEDEIAAKTALGYTYIGKITAAADYLTATDYAALIEDISTHTDSDYDYEEVSLFFIKTYTSTSVGPLMGTEWCQNDELDTIGHAWVCEGYEKIAYKGVISMIPDVKYSMVSTNSSLYQEYTFSITKTTLINTDDYGDFFYMNMGWGGDNNGWYRSNAYIDDDGHSYLYNQKIILIEKGD